MTFYFRHWYPRIGKAFDRTQYSNSVHYGVLWIGIILPR